MAFILSGHESYRTFMGRNRKKNEKRAAKELKESLIRVWENIEVVVLKKLVDSLPNKLNKVIRLKGYPTRILIALKLLFLMLKTYFLLGWSDNFHAYVSLFFFNKN